jgi:hypothetical protein
MTQLSLDARNLLALDVELRGLLGRSKTFDTWIFDQKPRVTLEGTQRVLVVLNEDGVHDQMNAHNTMQFPRLLVDVWADPSRLPDGSVQQDDADDKIKNVTKLLDRHFHTVNLDVPPGTNDLYGLPGYPRVWGTATQIKSVSGSVVLGSRRLSGPDFSDVQDGNGARMARLVYAVNTI